MYDKAEKMLIYISLHFFHFSYKTLPSACHRTRGPGVQL